MAEENEWKNGEQTKQINQDRFTTFMFGPRKESNQDDTYTPDHSMDNHSNINYEELMMNIDTLWESVRGLKPLFKKIPPFIEQFWKTK